jgi:ectoine hydroxylase-related dioxygenase (phytanoyl-CoA dioxygenase family)
MSASTAAGAAAGLAAVRDDHVCQYAAEGATLVPGVFDDAWIARLLGAIDRVLADARRPEFATLAAGNRTQNPVSLQQRDGDAIVRNVMHHAPEFQQWLRESCAAAVVGTVIGADHVRFWMDATFVKEGNADATATPWHNDGCTFPFKGAHAPSFWVALTDVEEDNAPLVTIAGSHLDPWHYRSPFSPQDVPLPPGYREWPELLAQVDAPGAVRRVWPARAGDVMLIHPKTLHGSLRRTTTRPGRRVAFTTRWLGSDIRWAPDPLSVRIATLEGNPRMRVGAPPPDELFPVLWRSSGAAG